MPPVITVENLEFSYGTAPVLRGLDLSVEAGGGGAPPPPPPAPPATLVENLLGSLTPTSGTVRVLGTDPRRAGADFWARIGLVQQNWTDHPKWRVKDQLEWIRSVQLTAASRVIGVDEVLDAVGLADKADSRLSRLSGGQRRTVDFAAALMAAPELLVLDEPTTGLDPVSKARLHDLILARVDENATIVMTTHDLAEAERLASRVLIMNEGRIIADGTVTALRERLDRGAEITWIEGGAHHIHTTRSPERFVKGLDLDAVTGLTITRPTLEETYLSLVSKEPRS